MALPDQIQRFLFEEHAIRGEIVGLNTTLKRVLERHNYPVGIKQLLGEFLCAASLLSTTLKFKGRLILQYRGSGAVQTVMAECTHHQQLRAIAQWDHSQDYHSELPIALSDGQLAITIEPDEGQRYQGIVAVESPHLSTALEDYFLRSEQLKTRIWLAANPDACAGLLLQALPEHASTSSFEMHSATWEHLTILTDSLQSRELLELSNETLLHRLYHEENIILYPPTELCFQCSCSKERSANALLALEKTELFEILEEAGKIDLDCQFCNEHYEFHRADIEQLFHGSVH